MLFFLIIGLIIVLITSYLSENRVLIAPSFIFSMSFLFSCIWALLYQYKWDLKLHFNTFAVILGGVILFFVTSMIFKIIYNDFISFNPIGVMNNYELKASTFKVTFLIFIESITIIYTIYSVRHNFPSSTLSQSILLYRNQTMKSLQNNNIVSYPGLGILRVITEASGYMFSYVLSENIINKSKLNLPYLLIFILAIVSGSLLGARNNSIMILLSLFVFLYYQYEKKHSWGKGINLKLIFLIIFGALLILLLFQSFAGILGRNITVFSKQDYLAIYFGAEIKNLDIFLQNGNFPIHKEMFGDQTFIYIHQFIGNITHNVSQTYSFDLPFMSVNGYSLGNVYTTFYSYIYDFGYIGVPILIIIMSIISQYIFEKVKRSYNSVLSIWTLLYGRVFLALALSFFSNKFYETIFNFDFIKVVVIWWVLKIIFFRQYEKVNKGVKTNEF